MNRFNLAPVATVATSFCTFGHSMSRMATATHYDARLQGDGDMVGAFVDGVFRVMSREDYEDLMDCISEMKTSIRIPYEQVRSEMGL